MKKLSFSASFFLIILIAALSGVSVSFLMGLLDVDFGKVASLVVMTVVMALLLRRLEKKENEPSN
ncbi:hypothetical protein [Pararhodonellum marinum]|uniref:hypothetical protein n=1 Tax=Pararhodonellum marinum TaxID=2755358 RepID=UPI00188E1A90|nr:hypothetical protein [Pararhodonellum marinum]